MLRGIFKHKQALFGMGIILFIVLLALFAPLLAPHSPNTIDIMQKFKEPSAQYPLGTDQLGRCLMSRLLFGARYSLGIALPMLAGLSGIGLVVGTAAGYRGGKTESVFHVVCNIFMAFPPIIIVMSLVGALGNGLLNVFVGVFLSMWAWMAKLVATYTAMEKQKDYIIAAKLAGCNEANIVFSHIIPNILPQFIVYVSTGVASMVLLLASFSFLGIGIEAGTPEWGAMMSEAKAHFYSHPSLVIWPGACILLTALGFNLFGEAVRDVVSPKGRAL